MMTLRSARPGSDRFLSITDAPKGVVVAAGTPADDRVVFVNREDFLEAIEREFGGKFVPNDRFTELADAVERSGPQPRAHRDPQIGPCWCGYTPGKPAPEQKED